MLCRQSFSPQPGAYVQGVRGIASLSWSGISQSEEIISAREQARDVTARLMALRSATFIRPAVMLRHSGPVS